ncbi:MAG: ribonuclease J [Campylobacterales bacterium]|nr:ribonuclease J [Campylobacterales bacterium]
MENEKNNIDNSANNNASQSNENAPTKEVTDQPNKRSQNQRRTPNNKRTSANSNNRNRGKSSKRAAISGDLSEDMKLSIITNKKVQDSRMSPWRKIDPRNNNKIRFTPLGGLGEIGGNMAVLETEESAVIIDVGMSFPDETMHGVDILVPDFSYLQTIKEKIKGIVITHAHEDHIGAMPYLFKKLKFPVYATPIALAMIENKFHEHGLKDDVKYFNYVTKREVYDIGDFKIEWMHVTHSIIDSSALAIQTPAGTIVHTADFKIDHTPIDNYTTDLHRLAYYGERGVLCLFSDSTNSHNPGFTKSEAVVGKTFDELFAKAKGRVIMSTFSSNIHRIYQAMERAVNVGKKICIIGRSMERNIETTRRLGYIDISDKNFIDAHEVGKHKDSDILIVTTGSQGEAMAALSRMATDEHRHIKLKPTDTVIISASAIPGNEGAVSRLMNLLMKSGVTVRYKEFSEIHVSGHAAQEEQKLMLRLIQPKFFLPVHGEYNHISQHAQTAIGCGVPERNIILMSDGDQVEITPKYLKKVKTVKSGKTYIDNQNNRTIENSVVLDRQKLASDGIVNIVAQISQENQRLVGKPVVTTYGLVADKETKRFSKEIEDILELLLPNIKPEALKNHTIIENEIRVAVKRHIVRTKKRYPLIIPTIFIL